VEDGLLSFFSPTSSREGRPFLSSLYTDASRKRFSLLFVPTPLL